jgi:hypothetical protein
MAQAELGRGEDGLHAFADRAGKAAEGSARPRSDPQSTRSAARSAADGDDG